MNPGLRLLAAPFGLVTGITVPLVRQATPGSSSGIENIVVGGVVTGVFGVLVAVGPKVFEYLTSRRKTPVLVAPETDPAQPSSDRRLLDTEIERRVRAEADLDRTRADLDAANVEIGHLRAEMDAVLGLPGNAPAARPSPAKKATKRTPR